MSPYTLFTISKGGKGPLKANCISQQCQCVSIITRVVAGVSGVGGTVSPEAACPHSPSAGVMSGWSSGAASGQGGAGHGDTQLPWSHTTHSDLNTRVLQSEQQ